MIYNAATLHLPPLEYDHKPKDYPLTGLKERYTICSTCMFTSHKTNQTHHDGFNSTTTGSFCYLTELEKAK